MMPAKIDDMPMCEIAINALNLALSVEREPYLTIPLRAKLSVRVEIAMMIASKSAKSPNSEGSIKLT